MLLNFCDPRLKPEVHCTTIHTEGYDVTNLITDHSKGFLAYNCIRPPLDIDFTFICDVQIHHVLLWPSVGSQKSSGFQLSTKVISEPQEKPHAVLASGCLKSENTGLLFYSAKINVNDISTPPTFLKRYIPASKANLICCTNNLRVRIWKTENSVPALGRIEVWGTVSPRCGRDVVATVHSLWARSTEDSPASSSKESISSSQSDLKETLSSHKCSSTIDIPEDFLDAITCEIMIQPIILPSGKIIDQATLEKYEINEAIWGRTSSDPFTALPFTEKRRPIVATTLKAKIDRFLLDNSNAEEVKRLPRVLGHGKLPCKSHTLTGMTFNANISGNIAVSMKNETCSLPRMTRSQTVGTKLREQLNTEKMKRVHRLPIVAMRDKYTSSLMKVAKKAKTSTQSVPHHEPITNCNEVCKSDMSDTSLESDLNDEVRNVLSTLKRFSAPSSHSENSIPRSCNCCQNSVMYKLPCGHSTCRKALTSTKSFQCHICQKRCEGREVERIYD